MIELLVIVTMIGIMSAAMIPKLRPSPSRLVRESARQLARDIELVRGRALATKRTSRFALLTDSTWAGYRDIEGDGVVIEDAASADSIRAFGVRRMDSRVRLGRGAAPALPGWPAGDPTSFTGSRFEFNQGGLMQPFGTQGVIYVQHRSVPSAVAAVTVTGAGSVRVWRLQGGVWQ
jgi:type II secretory pathway pseudopilin PulG